LEKIESNGPQQKKGAGGGAHEKVKS